MVDHAGRRRRRRRLVAAAVLLAAAAAAVAAVTTTLRPGASSTRGNWRRDGSVRLLAKPWPFRRRGRSPTPRQASRSWMVRTRGRLALEALWSRRFRWSSQPRFPSLRPVSISARTDNGGDQPLRRAPRPVARLGGADRVLARSRGPDARLLHARFEGVDLGLGHRPRALGMVGAGGPAARDVPWSERTSRTDIDARLINLWQRLWRRIPDPTVPAGGLTTTARWGCASGSPTVGCGPPCAAPTARTSSSPLARRCT